MRLIYHISEQARKRIFVESGRDPGQAQGLEVDPATLSTDDRRLLIEIDPTLGGNVQLTLPVWRNGGSYKDHLVLESLASDAVELLAGYRDARTSAMAAHAEAREQALTEQIERYAAYDLTWSKPSVLNEGPYRESLRLGDLRAAYAALQERIKAHEREQTEQERADEARKEAERAQHEQERAAWVMQHGSAHLRKCLDGGYDCQRLYAVERAAIEHPGYTLDYNDTARWKDRSGPSEAALDEAARVGGIVVWLTAEPSSAIGNEDWSEDLGPCEAVVIRGYLGKYDLVRFI